MKYNADKPDSISICNMSFFGHHGPFINERNLGNHYQADVHIYCDTRKASGSDSIKKTIDYSELYEITREVIEKSSYKLLETIAANIAEKILKRFEIFEVEVAVRKLKPAIHGVFDYVEVRINRKK